MKPRVQRTFIPRFSVKLNVIDLLFQRFSGGKDRKDYLFVLKKKKKIV